MLIYKYVNNIFTRPPWVEKFQPFGFLTKDMRLEILNKLPTSHHMISYSIFYTKRFRGAGGHFKNTMRFRGKVHKS